LDCDSAINPPVIARLDSSLPGGWSLACDVPIATLRCDGKKMRAALESSGRVLREFDHPRAALAFLEHCDLPGDRWVGYIAYETGRLFERLPAKACDDLDLPLFAFHRVDGTSAATTATATPPPTGVRLVGSTFDRPGYEAAVARVIEYVFAGDAYQVNLSQRFTVETADEALAVYHRLTSGAPAAYAAFLDFGTFQIVGNSPELFLSVRDGQIITRPIKGTRPRGPGMREQLRNSEKDQAELAMIVDLSRNDLGRVCEIGSVKVVEPRVIEEHPTVFHGVATVAGSLRSGATLEDILAATFPPGSVTGCPKIRAMQIIDELEPVARGPYCGAVGEICDDGRITLNVAIRTMTFKNGKAYVPVGGGIVAESTPAAEYEETIVKAKAMFAALGLDKHESVIE
jgi:para-aminobenzoate synthetase component I